MVPFGSRQLDRARGNAGQAEDRLAQCGLSTTRFADNADCLGFGDAEGNAVDGMDVGAAEPAPRSRDSALPDLRRREVGARSRGLRLLDAAPACGARAGSMRRAAARRRSAHVASRQRARNRHPTGGSSSPARCRGSAPASALVAQGRAAAYQRARVGMGRRPPAPRRSCPLPPHVRHRAHRAGRKAATPRPCRAI